MKSLSLSTATLAVAFSLASAAKAENSVEIALPENDEAGVSIAIEPILETAATQPAAIETAAARQTSKVNSTSLSAPHNETSMYRTLPEINFKQALQTLAQTQVLTNNLVAASIPSVPANGLSFQALNADTANERVVTTRSLDARYGDIDAFWGDIVAFYGDIDAFWGDINPFYGNINPFYGDISPFYGDIGAFWGDIDAFYGNIGAFDASNLEALGNFWQVSGAQISAIENLYQKRQSNKIVDAYAVLINQAEAQFGAAITAATGQSYDQFVQEFFARHGIDANNPDPIVNLTREQRARLFVDWHDTLMQYSGIDAIDHWMGAINWTPSLTQIQGSGADTIIGIIDSNFGTMGGDLADNVVFNAGASNNNLNGHGAGVASLIAAAHDGQGVMGIAPDVRITAYNPFGRDGTADWDDVANGIIALRSSDSNNLNNALGSNRRASVINMSLGEAGWVASQGLADILARPDIAQLSDSTIYVIAAGNDGIAQASDIEWGYSNVGASVYFGISYEEALARGYPTTTIRQTTSSAIFVGSIRPNGEISEFSNTPGNACLLDNGVCHAGNELMNRFIVAPGELLLVDDGYGGVTRRSGTSFAAPLVSGAIALLHDRWPWLVNSPETTAQIIFRSARDLGAPGVDPIYGNGLLDVTASQSPLDFSALTIDFYQQVEGRWYQNRTSANAFLGGGIPSWWETYNAYVIAWEPVGEIYRDFSIPLSSFATGGTVNSSGRGNERFQDYISGRFANWLLSNGADRDGDGTLGISQVRSHSPQVDGQWSLRLDAIQPQLLQDGAMRSVHNAATLTNPKGNMSFTLGHGHGALALAGNSYGIISDHDTTSGGINPVLGFASGEFFASASYKPASATTVSVGYSMQREDFEDLQGVSEIERDLQRQLGAREASAMTVSIEQNVSDRMTTKAQWTRLRESDALLGAQTGNDAWLGNGSYTDAITLSANIDFGDGLSFDLSATGAMTETADDQLFVSDGAAISTAGQFTVNKRGVMNSKDILRVSVGQPLTVERGDLQFRSEVVVDRQTGERGIIDQTIGIETKRRMTSEIVYATPLMKGSELGVIGRYVGEGGPNEAESFMIGANFGLRF